MKNFASYLLVMFMVIFWLVRVVIAFTYSMGIEFGIEPLDIQVEVVLLFVALLCMILVTKRKVIGGILYVLAYGSYFGVNIYNTVKGILEDTGTIFDYTTVVISFIGMIIPLAVLFDILLDKNRKAHPKDKKTDWFYTNKKFDRILDERADKNNYRQY